jgi:hypothetical protein
MGSAARWRDHRKIVEERLGAGHELYEHCSLMIVLHLLTSGELEEANRDLTELEERVGTEGDDAFRFFRGFLDMFARGNAEALRTNIVASASAPYTSRTEMRRMEALGAALGSGASTEDAESGPYDVLRRARENPDEGLFWLASEMESKGSSWPGLDQMFAIQVAIGLLGDQLFYKGAPSAASQILMSQIERMIAQPDFPEGAKRMVRIYSDALAVREGRPAAHIDERLPHLLHIRALLLRAAAARSGGHGKLTVDYLRLARARLKASDNASLWEMVATGHDRCGSPETSFLWMQIAELPDLDTDQRLRARAIAAVWLYRERRYSEAEPIEREILRERLAGNDEGDAAVQSARLNLAHTLNAEQRGEEARDLFRLVVAARERTLGERHRETADAQIYLAKAMEGLGERGDALPIQAAAVETLLQDAGELDPVTLDAQEALGRMHSALEELSIAKELWSRLVAKRREVTGDEDPQTLATKAWLVDAQIRLDEHAATRALAEEIVTTRERIAGPDNPHCRMAKLQLAQIARGEGRLEEAASIEREVLDSRMRTNGPADKITLEAMARLSGTLYRDGAYEEAEEVNRKLFDQRAENLKRVREELVKAGETLAKTLDAAGKEGEAEGIGEIVAEHKLALGDQPRTEPVDVTARQG